MSSSPPQLEDVPELMQLIQSRLPVKEEARTMVLSKSWLHAWSTLSTLRFYIREFGGGMQVVDMDRILKRYLHDNIPIERFDLDIDISNREKSYLAEKCIQTVATHKISTTLKELSLSYDGWCIDLPHEIFSCENLTKIRVVCTWGSLVFSLPMTSHDPVNINCVSLRELYLKHVKICQELLEAILSSCKLLVKIDLQVKPFPCRDLNTIKVTNLPCLYELRIVTRIESLITLEINHVPNLSIFTWEQEKNTLVPFTAHSISLGSSLKELTLGNMVTSYASLDTIRSAAPLLESLTLDMENWELGSFHFTCASIKRLTLTHCYNSKLTDIKVYASNLLFFCLHGETMPSLLFPLSTLIKETTFHLHLSIPVYVSFFLKMREALAISSNCDLYINAYNIGRLSLNINIVDLRTRAPFPHAMNVQRLFFRARYGECVWEHCSFFDALFEICHPNHVTAFQDNQWTHQNYFCKVMLTEVLEKKKTAGWLRYLEHVQIRFHEKWETLTNSHKIFLKCPTSKQVDFKLEWQ